MGASFDVKLPLPTIVPTGTGHWDQGCPSPRNWANANKWWGTSATASLWPYAMCMAIDTLNQTPNMKDESKRSPLQTISGFVVQINAKHWDPFGCPALILIKEIQDPKKLYHKWKYRSKVGIYLSRSPMYGRNIALILNRDTGLISPPFHVKLDPTFKSIDRHLGQQWILKVGLNAKVSRGREVDPQSK